MKTNLTLVLILLLSITAHSQVPFSEYLFTSASLQNTGSVVNSLAHTGSTLTGVNDRDGFADNAISLNGDILQEQAGENRTNFSVSFWIKTSTNDANPRYILDQWGGNPGGKGPIGYRVILENGELRAFGKFYVYNQNIHFISNNINTAGGTIADGEWHHVVLTMSSWSRSTLNGSFPNVSHRLFVDNVLQQLATVEIPTTGGTGRTVDTVPLSIGNIQDQSAEFSYEDQIDDIRMYTKKLEEAEIATIYEQRTSLAKIYVKSDAVGNNDGSSWTDAFTSLKAATEYATAPGDAIWVAQGVYKADASDRTASFILNKGVKLFGGFSGTETELSERDWRANPTVLSGDLNGDDDNDISYTNTLRSENTYRIVYVAGDNILIDGVMITGGQANNTVNNDYNRGAAIFKRADVKNLTVKNTIIHKNVCNREGNVHVPFTAGADNTLRVENCIVNNNFARYGGGFAASVENGATLDAKVYNSLFHANVAGDISAGDGFAGSSLYFAANAGRIDIAVINSTFTENEDLGTNASNDKGTIVIRRLNDNGTSIANATFHNNIFYNNLSSPVVVNEQVIGFMNRPTTKLTSLTFSYNISNQTDLSTKATLATVSDNINQDPMFSDAVSQDFTLTTGSPAIDTGSNDQLPDDLFGDISGNKRIHGGMIDMGVYESGSTPRNNVAPTATAQNITAQLESNGEITILASQVNNGSTDDDTPDNELIFSLDKATFTCEDLGANTVILTVKDASRNIATTEAIVTVTSNINDETVSIADDSFCTEASTTVSTGSSVSGINYFLRNSADNSVIDGPIHGTGDALGFNTGTITENTTFNVYGEVPPVNGVSGGLDFDGTNDNVNTTYTFGTTNIFTIEAWIFPSATSWRRLISNMASGSVGSNVGDFILDTFGSPDNGKNVRFTLDGEAADIQLYANQVLTLNEWNHVAVTFNNGLTKILVNGVEVASVNNPAVSRILGTSRPVNLGAQKASPARYFDGKMDEFRIWTVAKTNAEISAGMNKCLKGTENGLTAYYNFEDGEGTQLIEQVAGKNGTLVNFEETTVWAEGPELLCGAGCGFQMTQEVTLNVGDDVAPTAVAKDVTIYLDEYGTATLTIEDVNDGSSDNCTVDTDLELSIDKEFFFNVNLGANTVTLTVTDESGNESTADATVIVADNLAPEAIAQDLSIQLDANGNATITSAQINDGSNDNSTVTSDLILSIDKNTFDCNDVGENVVTLSVEDASGNTSTATSSVTVTETIAPMAVAQDITVFLDVNGLASIQASDIDNGSSDNCGVDQAALDVTEFTCNDLGANTVTLTVTDASGNSSTATATVTVEDNITPIAIAQDIIVQLDATGEVTISPEDIDNNSSDNCSIVSSSLDVNGFSCNDIGANAVILTVVDGFGNSSTASAIVTVEDNIVPETRVKDISIRLDANNSATLTINDIDDFSTDNCSEPLSFSISTSTFNESNLGANTVILTVEDGSGNSSTANAIVTVLEYKKSQTITFTAPTGKTYGDDDFGLAATASSMLPVDISIVSGPAVFSNNMVSITGAGEVTIELTQEGDDDYLPAPTVQESFIVEKAPLTVTAKDLTITYGDAIPGFTFVYAGFVNQEDESHLSEEPSISTTATAGSNAGVYPIELSGGVATNYLLTLVNGELSIEKANQTITIVPIEDKLSEEIPFSVEAMVDSNLELTYDITGPATISGNLVSLTGVVGTVVITVSQVGNENYNAETASVSFEVAVPAGLEDGLVGINVYPNPSSQYLKIEGFTSKDIQIEMFDLRGVPVVSKLLNGVNREVDVSKLQTGIYLLRLQSENRSTTTTILINR
ncbi:LamG-like jellyroll fold domain-containing protein [Reichenbachiella sp. MALMAid0571]|uniref:LamG-like jellyroll fold domain-containing protein n=1 Tax=Reichenbachiella sp. MALMAid0571 TaxID=3143939 RepID=UPI0032E046F3